MHFGLTDEQNLLQESLRRFTADVLPANRLRALFDAGRGFDETIWRGAAKVGLCGLTVPEAYGGAGLELLDQALAFEVLGEAALPGPFLAHALVCHAIARGGSEAQRRRWLPRLAAGEIVGGIALAESGDRWEPEDWQLESAGGYASGTKTFAHAGPECGLLVVGLAGGLLGLVEMGAASGSSAAHSTATTHSGAARLAPIEGSDRTRALAELQLEGAAVDSLAPDPEIARSVLDAARILLAADAFGAAGRLIRLTVDYAQTREQFDTPIAQFQAVKHQLANMVMEVEPMRGLVWYAAWAFDHRPQESARDAATAKAHITDRVVQVARSAVTLHGGIGFTWECDVHFWLKRAMFDRGWLGSPEAHRERLARLSGY
jgi:alkylation response protein AidB-like acyl-CoA dehydrogenase